MDIHRWDDLFHGIGSRNIDPGLYNVNNAMQELMIVPLTPREIEFIIGWKARAFWPDEERVLNKLRRALESSDPPRLSRLQVQIICGWAEEQLGGHYGGGEMKNPEEQAIMRKLQAALEEGKP